MKKRLVTILLILNLLFIWGNSLIPGELSGALSDNLMAVMNAAAAKLGLGEDFFTYMSDEDGDGAAEPTSFLIRKMAHLTEFALLGALLWLRLEGKNRRGLTAFCLGAAAGAADETIQIFSHRGSQLRDVFIDASGVLIGLGMVTLLRWLRRRAAEKKL